MPRLIGVVTALCALVSAVCGTAHGQSASPEALAAARELVVASRASDQLKTLLPLIVQQLKPAVVQGRPEVERDYDKTMPILIEAASQQLKQMIDDIAVIYASIFSAEELRQLTDFYGSPVGQKFLEKLPQVTQQSMQVGQKFGQRLMQDLQTRMTDELRRQGHKL